MTRFKDIVGTDVPTIGFEIAPGPEGAMAVYFRLSAEPIARTIEADEPDVLIDVAEDGSVVGVELINPLAVTLKKALKKVGAKYRLVEEFRKKQSRRIAQLEELIAV